MYSKIASATQRTSGKMVSSLRLSVNDLGSGELSDNLPLLD